MVGLIEKDTGSVYIQGKDISTRGAETRSICGYMPQTIDLDDELTIMENLSIYGQLHGLSSDQAVNNMRHWADILEFTHLLQHYPDKLSYGFKRKVLFVRALIHDPEVLLLDEPTTGMDPHSRRSVWNVLENLQKSKTIVFATQNFTEAERYADRIAILHNGNIKMEIGRASCRERV